MKKAIFAGLGRLGIPIVEHLIDNGWQVAVSCRKDRPSQQNINNLVESFGNDKITGIHADLTDQNSAQNFIKAAIDELKTVDALINIASGYPGESEDFQRWQSGSSVTDDDWKYYDSNFILIRNVITSLLDQLNNPTGLSIINFTDARPLLYYDENTLDPYAAIGGIVSASTKEIKQAGLKRLTGIAPPRHTNPYTLAKLDLEHLTKVLALKLAPRNIRVNAIAPGPMIPPPDSSGNASKAVAAQTALNRWGGTEPIIHAANFLLNCTYTTGQTIKTDGGLHLKQKFE